MKKVFSMVICVSIVLTMMLSCKAFSLIQVKSIKLDKSSITLSVGKTYNLKVTLTPSNTTQKLLTFATNNKGVATVDVKGKITAVNAGKAVITVTSSSNNKILAKCKVTVSKVSLQPVTLKFYFPGDKKPATDEVWKAIGDKCKDKLNAKFDINYIGWNDFSTKMTIIAASGDNYDMNFDANWTGLYPKMINENAYLPLNSLLPKYAPHVYSALKSAGALSAATVGGKIVCIPWIMSQNNIRPFLVWRQDIAQKYGLNYGKDSIKTIEDFNKFIYAAKKVLPKDIVPCQIGGATNPFFTLALIRDGLFALEFHDFVIDLNDPTYKIIPVEQTQAYKDSVLMGKQWVDDGIVSKNSIIYKGDVNADYRDGKVLCNMSDHEWANANWGFADTAAKNESSEMYKDKKSTNRSPLANVNALGRNSSNPERTLMFLDMVQTNRELYDLVMYGIEGKTYVLDGEKAAYPKGMTAQNSNYMEWAGQWAMWSPEFMRPTDQYPLGFWKREAEFAKNPSNVENKISGMFFNTDNIKNEIAKRDQLIQDNGKVLQYGVEEDASAGLNDYIKKQKAAGLDKILAELQKQVKNYLASNK